MPNRIPDGITREHLLEAIRLFEDGTEHGFADSTGYDLLHNDRRYPPKAIVGIAAQFVDGIERMPRDFSGGEESKCFRVLRENDFQIVPKVTATDEHAWILQGNPSRFDINDYLSRYDYIYWRAPRHRGEMQVGDRCIIWRAGADAGAIAIGRIAEQPCNIGEVAHPEFLGADLWRDEAESPDTIKVGIAIDEVRLDSDSGFLPRQVFLDDPVLQQSMIIRSPQGTVFKLLGDEVREAFSAWGGVMDATAAAAYGADEGSIRLRKHYARERCRELIDRKKKDFARSHDGRVFCEVCQFDFSARYPVALGEGFIEVHHLSPLASQDQPRRTTFSDLLLLCSNCHRMVHRTRDVHANLEMLRSHFGGAG